MSTPSKLDLVLAVTREIEQLQRRLDDAKGRLTQLIEARGPRPSAAPQKRKPRSTEVNVSATVLEYLRKHPAGSRVPDVVRDLRLEDRETAVRSALKKHASTGRAVNTHGVWTIAQEKGDPDWGPLVSPS